MLFHLKYKMWIEPSGLCHYVCHCGTCETLVVRQLKGKVVSLSTNCHSLSTDLSVHALCTMAQEPRAKLNNTPEIHQMKKETTSPTRLILRFNINSYCWIRLQHYFFPH